LRLPATTAETAYGSSAATHWAESFSSHSPMPSCPSSPEPLQNPTQRKSGATSRGHGQRERACGRGGVTMRGRPRGGRAAPCVGVGGGAAVAGKRWGR
jgi:hypothetical protein